MATGEVYAWGGTLSREDGALEKENKAPSHGESNCCWDLPRPVTESRGLDVNGIGVCRSGAAAVFSTHSTVVARPSSAAHGEKKKVSGGEENGGAIALQNLESIACGDSHSIGLLRASGALFAWGEGARGQLGLGSNRLSSGPPSPVRALSTERVISVACGAQHTAAVTEQGYVFTWGWGASGQLGLGNLTGVHFLPKAVPAFFPNKRQNRPAASVACGHSHTLVVTRAGEVWSFGEGSSGQLGYGRVSQSNEPRVCLDASCEEGGEPRKFVQAAAGWAHSVARAADGSVFSWGLGAHGQLGLGDSRSRWFPEEIPSRRFKSITAARHTSGGIDCDGIALSWGGASRGLLGRSSLKDTQNASSTSPAPISGLETMATELLVLGPMGGVAFVPTAIISVGPVMGPVGRATPVVLTGSGLWESENIVVRFTAEERIITSPTSDELGHSSTAHGSIGELKRTIVRSCIGIYKEGKVHCRGVPFPRKVVARIDISMNGQTFTSSQTSSNLPEFSYFEFPAIASVDQTLLISGSGCLRIHCGAEFKDLCDTPHIRLEGEANEEKRNIDVIGKFIASEGESCTVEIPVPAVDGVLPLQCAVRVSPDGVSFSDEGPNITIHDPRFTSISPATMCSLGGQARISGLSLWNAPGMTALIKINNEDHHLEATFDPENGELVAIIPPISSVKGVVSAVIEASFGNAVTSIPITVYSLPPLTLIQPYHLSAGGTIAKIIIPPTEDPFSWSGLHSLGLAAEVRLAWDKETPQKLTSKLHFAERARKEGEVGDSPIEMYFAVPPLPEEVERSPGNVISTSVEVAFTETEKAKIVPAGQLHYYESPNITKVDPKIVKDINSTVRLRGEGLLDTGCIIVRLAAGDAGSGEFDAASQSYLDLDAQFVDLGEAAPIRDGGIVEQELVISFPSSPPEWLQGVVRLVGIALDGATFSPADGPSLSIKFKRPSASASK